jgi:hypothetical protein
MGHRTVKRVPLDFDWPQGKVWEGYVSPAEDHPPDCEACGGRGETTARLWVGQIAHLALIADNDLNAQERGQAIHPWLEHSGTVAYGTRPSSDYREFGTGLAGREASFLGHDAIDRFRATQKLIEAAGLDPETWGICATCEGRGENSTPEQVAAREAWVETEPPSGEGWQLWETVSEGSPASPVFDSAEALAGWCEHNATWFADMRWTREEWLRSFLNDSTDVDSLVMMRERP